MNETPAFYKFVGVQGLIALALFAGFIYGAVAEVQLPENYTELLTFVTGFYFAKNGVGIIQSLKR